MHTKPILEGHRLSASGESHVLSPSDRTSWEGKPIGNHILLALPDPEFELLRPVLRFQDLPRNTSLHEPGGALEFVHFPNHGLVSLMVGTKEGKSVEVGVVGNEGLVGTPALVGLNRSPHRAVVQFAGNGHRIPVEALRIALQSSPHLQQLANMHAVLQGMHAAQSAACNRLHPVEQRLSRWLLIMQDRVEQVFLSVTHDFLATMLGTDRPSVSLAAGILQKKGAIEYTRGTVRIINRQRLEEISCECYSVMQQFTAQIGLP